MLSNSLVVYLLLCAVLEAFIDGGQSLTGSL